MKFKTLIVLLFVIIIVIFSLQNTEVTDVNLLFWTLSMSRVLVILGSFALGLIVGILISITRKTSAIKH
ncbi:lipopolysaccharide assembly protein LapA domain-containing protein [Mariniflexile ostreae]|uniref:Lipopolysaccharide assembly protein LapA domain-containing protein n=1 Tax=Mariniflexile ostreae TaxID=1520892 RepID=A0ABV5F7L7_9FLAO